MKKNIELEKLISLPREVIYSLMFVVMLSFTFTNSFAQQLAFPGAEGYGRFTTGGRGGRVIEVTNLNDDTNPGSFRYAINQSGTRTIVFRVSGTIHLTSAFPIKNGNVTIAGQTAPGDGICIAGYTPSIECDNVIVRYMRFRLGDVNDIQDDAFNGRNHKDIIIDHCSMTWSVDECASFYDNQNFTMQWCIVGESLYNSVHFKGEHGYGGIQGGWGATFHHNLYVHNTSRNPRFCGARYHTSTASTEIVDFVNNVIYNWGGNSVYGGELGQQNVRANYYKYGPATGNSVKNRILNPSISTDPVAGYGKFYVADNYVYGYPATTADNWTTGVQGVNDAIKNQVKVTTPFTIADVAAQTAEAAYESVLNNVGAILPRRDTVDARLVSDTRKGTATFGGATYGAGKGIIDSQTDVGGWPQLNSGSAFTDTDHDGMPDSWETTNGLNANDANDGIVVRQDGYTNLEHYLNSITTFGTFIPAPTNLTAELVASNSVKLTWQDNSTDETGFKIERKTVSGSFVQIAAVGSNVTTYTDAGLAELTTYQYRVISYNSTLQTESIAIEISTLSATSTPLAVSNQNPADGEKNVNTNATLTWKAGLNTASYDVYYGTTNPPAFIANQTTTSYKPAAMEMGKTYYWKVEPRNANGVTTASVLSFTTKTKLASQKIAQWKLDEPSGNTAIDAGNYSNNGTLYNFASSARVSGISGNALNFDGTDDYVYVPNNGTIDFAKESFSISLWYKVGTLTGSSMYLINKGSFVLDATKNTSGNWYGFEIKSNQLRFSIDDNVTKTTVSVSNVDTLLKSNWNNIVGVRDSSQKQLRLYINNKLAASIADATGDISETEPLYFGNSSDKTATLSGSLDDIRIYNYALSASEIQNIYKEFITDVEENDKSIPSEYTLRQNYPNPFNPSTIISYQLPAACYVTLKVFDVLGKEVATLVNEFQQAGNYNSQFSISNLSAGRQGSQLSSGVYFYTLKAGKYVSTKKMILMK